MPIRLGDRVVACLASLLVTLGSGPGLRAEGPAVSVSVLLRAGDPIPLGPGNFKTLSIPAIDEGFIAFEGTSTTDPLYRSIFRSNGLSVTRMAETFTAMPGGGGALFSAFGWGSEAGQLAVDGVFVTFVGRDVAGSSPGALEGIYTSFTPLPAMVFDSTPGGGGYLNYGLYGEPSREGALVTSVAAIGGKGAIGIMVRDLDSGRTEMVKQIGQDLPGIAGLATDFSHPMLRGGRLVYAAKSGQQAGIYLRDLATGAESVVADTSMLMPGSATPFATLARPSMDTAGNVVFHGIGTGRQGFYRRMLNGSLERLADSQTPVPGGSGTFGFLPAGMCSIDEGVAVFAAIAGAQGWSIFRAAGASLDLMLKQGDPLAGSPIINLAIGRQAIDGPTVAFRARTFGGLDVIATAQALPSQVADIDEDGVVGPVDLSVILGAWGPCNGAPCPGDLDGDGIVGANDIAVLLGGWSGPPFNDESSGALAVGFGVHPFTTVFATDSTAPLAGNSAECDEGEGEGFSRDIWFRVEGCGTLDHPESIMTVSTCGSTDFDTRLAIYTESTDGSLDVVSCSDDALGCEGRSQASWIAQSGASYLVRLGGGPTGPSQGEGVLLVGCSPPFDLGTPDGDSPTLPLAVVMTAETNWTRNIPLPPFSYGASPYQATNCPDSFTSDVWLAVVAPRGTVARVQTCQFASTQPLSLALYRGFAWTQPILCGTVLASCSSAFVDAVMVEWVARPGELYFVRVGTPDPAPLNLQVRCEFGADRCADRDCFSPHDLIGCDSLACCSSVCAADPFCCSTQWDGVCAQLAKNGCEPPPPTCGAFSTVSCYKVDLFPGCNDTDCCIVVCAVDLVCCDVAWDATCVEHAVALCVPPSCPVSSDLTCFESHLGPGCEDPICCGIVCDVDPACCQTNWDGFCALHATLLCPP
jgi:hypothetical protein